MIRFSPTISRWVGASALVALLAIPLVSCAPLNAGSAAATVFPEATYPAGKWKDCPLPGQVKRQCMGVEVGQESNENATQVRLAVALTPAEKTSRGILIVDPGGPTISGALFQASFAARAPQSIRDNFDIVGYDRRGFGASSPTTCEIDDPPAFEASSIDEDWSAYEPQLKRQLAECQTNREDPVFTAGIRAGVRDLEAVREALKVDQVNMLAISYGTLLGQAYLAEHPDRVRTMILDGVVDPTVSGPVRSLNDSLDLETAKASYGTDRDPKIAEGFAAALTELQKSYPAFPSYSQDLAYLCTDFTWPTSPAGLAAWGLSLEEQADVLTSRAPCVLWPTRAPVGTLSFKDSPKPLIINSTKDARTPLAGAQAVARATGGTLLTMPGPFHGLTGSFTCPTQRAADYLLSGILPAPGECPAPKVSVD
ncbi:alpha/beta fold hydrolase [Lysinibacter sp. HNR]|uniref:alpha/beta fold hydrolase n=1 Tax=Lysinibacter sp. HNR TaxID=3031408 RepID=UPI00243595E7|nr:alpha/beta fold hydrolase [Lysinibacter sp. HNR]WGD36961.1 alpha/beta fold hydrolase [Lysinibacter sp. HNR]WGD36980.1 alpha/beta fold hydrolase [Lysinibacter sp. HNR]